MKRRIALSVNSTRLRIQEKLLPGHARTTTKRFRGNHDIPSNGPRTDSAAPFWQASFSGVNLLSTTDQSDNHTPVGASFHDAQHHLRFGPFATALFCHLMGVPGSLCLVEHYNALGRRGTAGRTMDLQELMYVLDKRADNTAGRS